MRRFASVEEGIKYGVELVFFNFHKKSRIESKKDKRRKIFVPDSY